MAQVAIVGAGVGGLHLGLFLQQHGVPTQLYAERTPEQQQVSRLPYMAAHFGPTRAREHALGVDYWDAATVATHVYCSLGGPHPLAFRGQLEEPCQVIDPRLYLARLLEGFLAAGGAVKFGIVTPAEVPRLAEQHDLVVVTTGRGGLADLFPVVPEWTPFSAPARLLCTGFYRGLAYRDRDNLSIYSAPGHGELFEVPVASFDGAQHALIFQAIPGGAFAELADLNYPADPARFAAVVLGLLRAHFPEVAARVTPAEFGLTRVRDLVQGALVPRVRRGYTRLPSGRLLLALGEAHVLNNPLLEHGAGTAAYGAWVLGQAVLAAGAFDEPFCRQVEARIWEHMRPVTAWSNCALQPPPAHVIRFLAAAAQNPAIADVAVNTLAQPQRGWDILSSPRRTERFLGQYAGVPAGEP